MTAGSPERTVTKRRERSVGWLGDSEMAQRVLALDWSTTGLGPLDAWPASLRSAVATCLRSPSQMTIYWGPELICIYNDAERDVLGNLHPTALGLPARELLHDSWAVLEPQLRSVLERGEAVWATDRPLRFDRRGLVEAGYFTYSYSPIADGDGAVGGVLLVSQETTARVLAKRRTDALWELAMRSIDAPTAGRACAAAVQALDGAPDVPFMMAYLVEPGGARAGCAAASSSLRGSGAIGKRVELDRDARGAGALLHSLAASESAGRTVAADLFAGPAYDGCELPRSAFAAPIRRGSSESVAGFLAIGISDTRVFDDDYRRFLEMVVMGVARSVAAARAREAQRELAHARERAHREAELRPLLNDLRAAQRRVVAAGDAERRRIERNLHDGAQQRLMAIRLELGLIDELIEREPGRARAELERLRGDLDAALNELRALAHGLYPPLLASDGLHAALAAVSRSSPIPVEVMVEGDPIGRLARDLENAVYFCCVEALQNVARHAGAGARASILLALREVALKFRVSDDGAGFDARATGEGHGLTNLRDRIAALGGHTEIVAAPGRGTTVSGHVPLR